jgi:trk system potassium uptake protein TrkA
LDKQFAIIGLGRFGGNLCKYFYELGVEFLAVDSDPQKVNQYGEFATQAVQANAADEDVLLELGIRNFDYVLVSLGEDIQSSVLTTLILKELGVSQVWVKAENEYHHKVLEKVGADRIIHPEPETAKRIANHIVSEKVVDYIELSEQHSILEIVATKKLHDKTLAKTDIHTKYHCTVVALKRDQDFIVSPSSDQVIHKEDILVVIGHNEDLQHLESEGI